MPNLSNKTGVSWAFFCLAILLVTACSSKSREYQTQVVNYYMPVGWIKFKQPEQLKPTKKRSGYQLIQLALEIDQDLQDVLNYYGQPDYVRASAKNRLNLAYLQQGIVLSFVIKSGVAPNVIEYSKFNNLSQQLVKLFKSSN